MESSRESRTRTPNGARSRCPPQYPSRLGRNKTTPGRNAITGVSAGISAGWCQSGGATFAGSVPPTERATRGLAPPGARNTQISWVVPWRMSVPIDREPDEGRIVHARRAPRVPEEARFPPAEPRSLRRLWRGWSRVRVTQFRALGRSLPSRTSLPTVRSTGCTATWSEVRTAPNSRFPNPSAASASVQEGWRPPSETVWSFPTRSMAWPPFRCPTATSA